MLNKKVMPCIEPIGGICLMQACTPRTNAWVLSVRKFRERTIEGEI
jgi:hypothetical protein